MSFILLKWRGMGLGGLFLASLMTMGVCSGIEGALQEIRDENSGRLAVVSHEHPSQLLLEGTLVTTVFWGPAFQGTVASFQDFPPEAHDNLALSLQAWAEKKCRTSKLSKISLEVLNASVEGLAKTLLQKAGFKEEALVYTLSAEDFRARFGALEAGDGANIFPLRIEEEERLEKARLLFVQFNKTMRYVPGLFQATVRETLRTGGEILIHENSQTGEVDGLICFAYFQNKDLKRSILIDSLFVSQSARGQGLGTALSLTALRQAFEKGAQAIYWETRFGRQDARAFYAHFHLDPHGVAFRYQPPISTSVMNFLPDVSPYMIRALPSMLMGLLGFK